MGESIVLNADWIASAPAADAAGGTINRLENAATPPKSGLSVRVGPLMPRVPQGYVSP
jgi:hypothetical protein